MNRNVAGILIWLVLPTILLSGVITYDLVRRGFQRHPLDTDWPISGANAERGRELTARYGCGACHVIPGVPDAFGRVGPKLEDFGNQMYIAGVMMNTPSNLERWIREPRVVNPRTAMPDLNVTEQDARDIAAYLKIVP